MPVETVLLIDSDPIQLARLGAHLANLGYVIIEAADAALALQKARRVKIDAVVSQAVMPGTSGFALCRALRADEKFAKIPVILFTSGGLEPGSEAEARRAGADRIVAEGADFEGIVDALSGSLPQPQSNVSEDDAVLLAGVRSDFLAEAEQQTGRFVAEFESGIDLAALARCAHRWGGTGKLLGYEGIGRAAAEIEALLTDPVTGERGKIFSALQALRTLILSEASSESRSAHVAATVRKGLAGKRFGLVNFADTEISRISLLLREMKAYALVLDPCELEKQDALEAVDVLIVSAGGQLAMQPDIPERAPLFTCRPHLIVGDAESIGIWGASEGPRDFILRPWDAEELFFRCYHLLSRVSKSTAVSAMRDSAETKARILLVDDDPTIISLVRMTLESYKIECHTADRGGLAFDMALRIKPDAIVLDINMPELDGFAVLTRLRQTDRTRSIPVVMLTALRQEKDVIRGFALGADDYVVKPFNPIELAARLRRLLKAPAAQ